MNTMQKEDVLSELEKYSNEMNVRVEASLRSCTRAEQAEKMLEALDRAVAFAKSLEVYYGSHLFDDVAMPAAKDADRFFKLIDEGSLGDCFPDLHNVVIGLSSKLNEEMRVRVCTTPSPRCTFDAIVKKKERGSTVSDKEKIVHHMAMKALSLLKAKDADSAETRVAYLLDAMYAQIMITNIISSIHAFDDEASIYVAKDMACIVGQKYGRGEKISEGAEREIIEAIEVMERECQAYERLET